LAQTGLNRLIVQTDLKKTLKETKKRRFELHWSVFSDGGKRYRMQERRA